MGFARSRAPVFVASASRYTRFVIALVALLLGAPELQTDDRLIALPAEAPVHRQLSVAAECLKSGPVIELAEARLDGAELLRMAEVTRTGSVTRALREQVGRAVKPAGFVRFVDDVCAQKDALPSRVVIPPGRARGAGILLHPKEVFRGVRITYGAEPTKLAVDAPLDYRTLPRPPDGAVIGPDWAARYLEPEAAADKLERLAERNPDFARRVRLLIQQLKAQGVVVEVESAVRRRERGLLLYGSFVLSRARSPKELDRHIQQLEVFNEEWKLRVPITWRLPGSWTATVEAARQLADTYGVVYATVNGARRSRHYEGTAIDLTAVALPRKLTLKSPGGDERSFDLSAPAHPRELSLAPELIAFVESAFGLKKLLGDYPHWNDAER